MQHIVDNLKEILSKQFGSIVNQFEFSFHTIKAIKEKKDHYGTPGVYIWYDNGKPLKVGKHNAGAGERALEHLGVTYKKGRFKEEEVTIPEQAILVLIIFKNSWNKENYWKDESCLIESLPWLLAIEVFLELKFRLEYSDCYIYSRRLG